MRTDEDVCWEQQQYLDEQRDFFENSKFEIKVYDSWLVVSWNIFRSWGGERKLNDKLYDGPSYYFLSNTRYERT